MTAKIELKLNMVAINGIASHFDEKTKSMTTSFKVNTGAKPEEVARIMNLQSQGAPMFMVIGSDQAKMDLDIKPITV